MAVLFTLGAIIDLIVVARNPLLVRAQGAPQLRGLSLGRWPARRPSAGTTQAGGAFSPSRLKNGPAIPEACRRYRPMVEPVDGEGLASPTKEGGGASGAAAGAAADGVELASMVRVSSRAGGGLLARGRPRGESGERLAERTSATSDEAPSPPASPGLGPEAPAARASPSDTRAGEELL